MLPHSVSRRAGLISALVCLATLAGFSSPARAGNDAAAHAAVIARVKDFMNRYEQNDQDGVMAMVDKREITVIAGPGEKVTSIDGFRAFMTRNFQQWQTARFTDIRDLDVRVGKDLATAYFLFTFAAADQPGLPIRVSLTWRKDGKEWLLTQCASAPLQGQ